MPSGLQTESSAHEALSRQTVAGGPGPAALFLALAALLSTALVASCGPRTLGPAEALSPGAAIEAVLARDSELGTLRNHSSESGSLAQAVRDYVEALEKLEFSACPADFTAAFERHREAWRESVPFFADHSELRGEMHDLFELIRARGGAVRTELEGLEREIWGTWAEVEAAAGRHGVGNSTDSDGPPR